MESNGEKNIISIIRESNSAAAAVRDQFFFIFLFEFVLFNMVHLVKLLYFNNWPILLYFK